MWPPPSMLKVNHPIRPNPHVLTSVIDYGWSAMNYVALYGKAAIARMLVAEHGADLTLCDQLNAPPLQCATGNGHQSPMKLLLNNGVDMKAQDCLGVTSLHQAGAAQARRSP